MKIEEFEFVEFMSKQFPFLVPSYKPRMISFKDPIYIQENEQDICYIFYIPNNPEEGRLHLGGLDTRQAKEIFDIYLDDVTVLKKYTLSPYVDELDFMEIFK